MKKIRAGIVGISGYTGEELLKILFRHPSVDVTVLCGRSTAENKHLKDIYPHLGSHDISCRPLDIALLAKETDVVFLALPHTVSFEVVPQLIKHGKRVVDLSADFRLTSSSEYEKWYGAKHSAGELLAHVVYGLPEFNRKKIESAQLVANPGCYPTTILLALAPIIKEGIADTGSIIIDSKSGISGAGRKSVESYFKSEHPNMRPYNIAGGHRHIPEIEQELSNLAGNKITVTFTPHILPVERGMLSTIYVNLTGKTLDADIDKIYDKWYGREQFVRVLPKGKIPEIRNVLATNMCEIGYKVDERTNRLVIVSAIDNLVKGASGQAVQNMNIMYGLNEKEGLTQ